MHILIITPYTPDNQGVGVSYTSQLIAEIAKYCLIDLVYFRYADEEPYKPINKNIKVIKESVISSKYKIFGMIQQPLMFPLFSSRFNKKLCRYLQKRINDVRYDYLYFDFSQTFSYAKYLDHPNKILMSHDVIAQKYSRMKTYLRPWAMASEKQLLRNGSITFTFSDKDCQLIHKLYNIESKSTTFFLNKNVIDAVPTCESNYFVFFGAWDRVENSEALEWFLDNVYDNIPTGISFKIIGGGLSSGFKKRISHYSNIEYLGFVDNPYPIIANAKAEIAALHMGAGVKVKCVEALGSGTPIIGTEVAFEGIGDEYRKYMIMANTPHEYIDSITQFPFDLSDKKEVKKFFIKHYNQKNILKYLGLYK